MTIKTSEKFLHQVLPTSCVIIIPGPWKEGLSIDHHFYLLRDSDVNNVWADEASIQLCWS